MHKPRYSASVVFLGASIAMSALAARAADAPKVSTDKEKELIGVLSSDAPKPEKALACKGLAVYGSSAAVGELGKLLSDEELASWARIALEAIPGEAADEALRKAQDGLQGKLLVGVINSIGVRRDAQAADALAKRLQDKDAEVASSAAAALGRIASDAATKSLRNSLAGAPVKVRSAIAEGLVLCAERLQAAGRDAEAIEIYDEVRQADVPKQRKIEATRAAILARKQDGIALLLEQLHSPDKAMFQLALGTAREIPGDKVDSALVGELAHAKPDRAALIVVAMADRKDTVALPAILKAAAAGPKEVRLAALGALGRLGDASCLSAILEAAIDSDSELADAAKAAAAELPAGKVDQEIIAGLAKAQGKTYPVLIELVGKRRIQAVEPLVKALGNADQAVRNAALASLGETVSAKQLGVLISQVAAPKHVEDIPAARQALKAAAIRMPDREACAAELSAAMTDAPMSTKIALLEILGAVGGSKSLAALGAAAKSDDSELQDASSRLLGEWMTIDAAPVLLDLAKTGGANKFQGRELRGYIRIARQFVMPIDQRAEMCGKALEACRQPAEQKLVLDVLKRYPSQETLKLAVKIMQTPELKSDAAETALVIAQKLGGKADEVREIILQAGLDNVKLEIVKAEYGVGATQKDVTATLQKQLAGLPLVTLPSANYNEAFGGDPAPGTPKQLKVQYRINGKAGEASFAENALIVLPMPK